MIDDDDGDPYPVKQQPPGYPQSTRQADPEHVDVPSGDYSAACSAISDMSLAYLENDLLPRIKRDLELREDWSAAKTVRRIVEEAIQLKKSGG